ncbi:MAG: hypothetical protein ACHQ4J_10080 [Candidatus Binatia bacterium]
MSILDAEFSSRVMAGSAPGTWGAGSCGMMLAKKSFELLDARIAPIATARWNPIKSLRRPILPANRGGCQALKAARPLR